MKQIISLKFRRKIYESGNMFNAQLLQSLVHVVEAGSITKAAERLNLTQSAVSAQIQKLEEQANFVILERTTRSQKLTVKGELLLGYAKQIVALHEQAKLRLGSTNDLSGCIKLGCSEGFVADWLFPIVSSFNCEHQDVAIQIELGLTTELLAQAEQGGIDLIVGPTCKRIEGAEHLWSEPLMWAFANQQEPDWSKPLPIAVFPEPCPYREVAISSLEDMGTRWQLSCTSPSLAGVQSAALAGLAVTPLTMSSLISGLAPLPQNEFLPFLPEAHFAIIPSSKKLSNPARMLADVIRSSAYGLKFNA